jgi:hypothetical protein
MTLRLLFAAVWLASSALAGPPLTTIQDVLYKADGTRFNGTVTISWTSFQAMDNSTIATQTITVKIVDGNLHVQLVPTTTSTPTTYYSATYNSNGRIQFQETWSVPSSAQPLHVRDVRVATASNVTAPAADTSGTTPTPVPESDIVGLIADLGARPLKGAGFAAGRTAVVDGLGALESASGTATDCVHVDGSSGPCGGAQPSFMDGDSPAGIVDGSNTSFTLSAIPNPTTSLAVYRNGVLQKTGQDYAFTGTTLQFVAASTPQPGDTLLASYRLTGTDSGTPQMYPSPQVLCSGTGAATTNTSLTSTGACAIPSGLLVPGDRVEIRFDFAHQGTASGFSFEIHWGATTIVHRDAAAGEALAGGRADAALLAAGAQLSSQTWGALLAFGTTVGSATDSYTSGLTVDFQGMLAQAGDTLTLGNYTVVRFP